MELKRSLRIGLKFCSGSESKKPLCPVCPHQGRAPSRVGYHLGFIRYRIPVPALYFLNGSGARTHLEPVPSAEWGLTTGPAWAPEPACSLNIINTALICWLSGCPGYSPPPGIRLAGQSAIPANPRAVFMGWTRVGGGSRTRRGDPRTVAMTTRLVGFIFYQNYEYKKCPFLFMWK